MSSIHPPDPRLHRSGAATFLAIVGCAVMLAGCVSDYEAIMEETPKDYRQRHPIAIQEGVHTVELFIGSKRGELSMDQRADVIAFAQTWRRQATGGVLIDIPSGTSNAAAAAAALREIRAILTGAGVPPGGIEVRPYRPADARTLATVRLNYPTMVARVGPCGLWPHDLGATFDREHNENIDYWNHGCAGQHNIAAMVENPADLVQPRGETPSYTGRRLTVVDKYRRGEGPATVYPPADQGKISDIGK